VPCGAAYTASASAQPAQRRLSLTSAVVRPAGEGVQYRALSSLVGLTGRTSIRTWRVSILFLRLFFRNPTDKNTVNGIQPFSQKSHTPTVPKEFQIGLHDPAEADLEHFWNCCSVGFLGERLYCGACWVSVRRRMRLSGQRGRAPRGWRGCSWGRWGRPGNRREGRATVAARSSNATPKRLPMAEKRLGGTRGTARAARRAPVPAEDS